MSYLEGYCVLWVPRNSCIPQMTSNLADAKIGEEYAKALKREQGARIIAVFEAKALDQIKREILWD